MKETSQRMGNLGRSARVGKRRGELFSEPKAPFGLRQQRNPAVGSEPSAVEGGPDFLAPDAWQRERKQRRFVHGGRGAP